MKKILIIGIVVVAVIVVLLLTSINPLIKKGVETAGPEILKAPVTLEKSNVSFFSGSGELDGLTIGNPEGFKTEYAFQLGRIKVDLDPRSLTGDKIHIKDILIDAPKIIFEGTFGKSNLNQLIANVDAFMAKAGQPTAGEKTEAKGEEKKKVQIDHVTIQNGEISVSMSILQGKKLSAPLPPLELRDIGKQKDTTLAEAAKQILAAVNKAAVPAVQTGLSSISGELQKAGEILQQQGGTVQEKAQKDMDTLKGLFNK
jgi:uncharacterized protein involved in outer membrane biogenesis